MTILFTILTVLASLTTIFFGAGSLIVALVFGIIAIILSAKKKKNGGGGVAGIVVCVIFIVCSGLVTVAYCASAPVLKDQAVAKSQPNLEKYSDNLAFGPVGLIVAANKDGVDNSVIMDELNAIVGNSKSSDSSSDSAE